MPLTTPTPPEPEPDDPTNPPTFAPWVEFARAPLVRPAVAFTVGIMINRYGTLPWEAGLVVAAAGILAWLASAKAEHKLFAMVTVWVGLGFLHHHLYRHHIPTDDVSHLLNEKPQLMKLRGIVDEEPTTLRVNREDPFVPGRKLNRGSIIFLATDVFANNSAWQMVRGRVRLSVERDIPPGEPFALDGLQIGDEIEVLGFVNKPTGPMNPGERDWARQEQDNRVRAEMHIGKGQEVLVRLRSREAFSWDATLVKWRGQAARIITDVLPEAHRAVATALLLGDSQAMTRAEWDAYVRTGVVHVLAISGQHLVVLAGFVWVVGRVLNIRGRYVALAAVAVVVGYACLTGLRPSSVRAAIMVAAVGVGFALRRPVLPANSFAFAWLVVAALNPTDVFTPGNLLSFLSVFVLIWGVGRWQIFKPPTNLERLIHQSRPFYLQALLRMGKAIWLLFVVNAVLFVANAPLIADRQNLVSPVALLLGPPLVVLSSVALLAGFLMLLAGTVSSAFAWPFAMLTSFALAACGSLVKLFQQIPGGVVYLPAPPLWWLIGFYGILLGLILLGKPYFKRGVLSLLAWVVLGLLLPTRSVPTDELRVTFLAVGHGTCVVMESPDGRVMLYDTGSMAGPEAVRRTVAPYLWSRGIRHIDEVFLSHADVDHFNGFAELLKRFPVGQVTMTPTFATKATAEVDAILAAIRKYNVPARMVVKGDVLECGTVKMEVLHPPRDGLEGTENERSLVLAVRYANRSVLLTGDLEKAGTALATAGDKVNATVTMAPHHGSRVAYTRAFKDWAGGGFVVVSKGIRDAKTVSSDEAGAGVTVWETVNKGAITVRLNANAVVAEAFKTGEVMVVKSGK